MAFTPEELAEMAAADEEIEREFQLDWDEIQASRERDKKIARVSETKKAEYQRRYREKHRDKVNQWARERLARRTPEEKERDREYHKRNYQENREARLSYQRAYDEANRERIIAYRKEYYQKNKEKINARNRAYKKAKRAEGSKTC